MGDGENTAISVLVRERMIALGMQKQAELTKRCDFDQGLLSKLLCGDCKRLSLESALKLAVGIEVHPDVVFGALGKLDDWGVLVGRAYRERATGDGHPSNSHHELGSLESLPPVSEILERAGI